MNEKELASFIKEVETQVLTGSEHDDFFRQYPIMTTLLNNFTEYSYDERSEYAAHYAALLVKELKGSKLASLFNDIDATAKTLLLWPAALDMNLGSSELEPINVVLKAAGLGTLEFDEAVDFLNDAISTGAPTYAIAVLKSNQPASKNILTYFLRYATSIVISDADLDEKEFNFLTSLESSLKEVNVKEAVDFINNNISSDPETAEHQNKLPHMFKPLINLNRMSDQQRVEYAKFNAAEFYKEFNKTLAKKHGADADKVVITYLSYITALDCKIAPEEFDYLTQVLSPLGLKVTSIDSLVNDYLVPALETGLIGDLMDDLTTGKESAALAEYFVKYSSSLAGADGDLDDEEFDLLFEIQDFLLNV